MGIKLLFAKVVDLTTETRKFTRRVLSAGGFFTSRKFYLIKLLTDCRRFQCNVYDIAGKLSRSEKR